MTAALPTPPEVPGLPLVGNLFEFRQDPVALCRRGHALHGPVFSFRLGPQRVAVLVGPEHHRALFTQTGSVFSLREVYRFLKPITQDNVGYEVGEESYRRFRNDVQGAALAARRIPSYVPAMVEEARAWLDGLGDHGELELVGALGRVILSISARTLIGPAFRERCGEAFFPLFRDLFDGIDFMLPASLPLPRFRRFARARRRIAAMIHGYLVDARRDPSLHGEFTARLCAYARTRTGDEDEADRIATNAMLGLLWGAGGTTTGQTAWALVLLVQHPEELARVRAELAEVLPGGAPPDGETLSRLRRVEWVLRETERLRPVMPLIPRYNAEAYEVGGYRVPRGWFTMLCPAVSHTLPEVFTDPGRFDPGRFDPGRSPEPVPYQLIGFGGAAHRCAGEHFAMAAMQVLIALMLQRHELQLVGPPPRPSPGFAVSGPEVPCAVAYRRREAP
jgi:sterol 14-demethylase